MDGIFPERCMTCGKVIQPLWPKFKELKEQGLNARQAIAKLPGIRRNCCISRFTAFEDIGDKYLDQYTPDPKVITAPQEEADY